MGVAVPTEDTITDVVVKEELERRGIGTAPQMMIQTPVRRYKPDLYLVNGGSYVLQAKLGNEAKLIEAIGQVHDGIRYAGVTGGFAVIYPEGLRRPMPIGILKARAGEPSVKYKAYAFFGPADPRPMLPFTGSLEEFADWVAQQVLQPPKPVAPEIQRLIDILRRAADYILLRLKHLREQDLEHVFGGKSVFDNILQYEKGKYPLGDLRRAAAFLLINQTLFYQALSSGDPAKYPEMEEDTEISRPRSLLNYFRKALDIDYTPIFGFDIVSSVPDREVNVIRNVIKVVKAIGPQRIGHDVLGQLFHELIPLETRKPVAAYYTNVCVAEMLARLAIGSYEAKVIDLAVGSGGLLASAYRAKKDLLDASRGAFGLKDHKRFVERDLTGIDVMPFAGHLAAINLSLQSRLYETEKVRIAIWDSTELSPSRTIPPITRVLRDAYRRLTLDPFIEGRTPQIPEEAYVTKGVLTPDKMGGEEIKLERTDLAIMNPPFTRQERIKSDVYKKALLDRFKDYRRFIRGPLGYHGYFLFLADRFLKTGGRMALVLPATVLRVKTMRGVRRLLVQNYHVEYIITTWQRAAFTEDAQFREILLVARKVKRFEEEGLLPPDLKCAIIYLKGLPKTLEEAKTIAKLVGQVYSNTAIGRSYEDDAIRARMVAEGEIEAAVDNMFALISAYNWEVEELWAKILKRGS